MQQQEHGLLLSHLQNLSCGTDLQTKCRSPLSLLLYRSPSTLQARHRKKVDSQVLHLSISLPCSPASVDKTQHHNSDYSRVPYCSLLKHRNANKCVQLVMLLAVLQSLPGTMNFAWLSETTSERCSSEIDLPSEGLHLQDFLKVHVRHCMLLLLPPLGAY